MAISLSIGVMDVPSSKIAYGSCTISKSAGNGDFATGGCGISSCKVTIMDDDGMFDAVDIEGTDIVVYVNGVVDWKGTIKTATQTLHNISVVAYDYMDRADDHTVGEVFTEGITRNTLVNAMCGVMQGVTVGTLPANGSDTIPEMDSDLTFRQAFSYIAQAGGQFPYFDSKTNQLHFKWYNFSSAKTVNVVSRNLNRLVTAVDGLDLTSYDGTKTEEVIGDGLTVSVSGNPCITADEDVFGRAFNLIRGACNRQFISGDLTISNTSIDVGDVVSITHRGQSCYLPVASLSYKPGGNMKVGCNDVEQTSDKRVSSSKQEVNNAISDTTSKLNQAISEGGGGGGSSTTQHKYITFPYFAKKNTSGEWVLYNSISASYVTTSMLADLEYLLTVDGIEGLDVTSVSFDNITFAPSNLGLCPQVSILLPYKENIRSGTKLSDVDVTGRLKAENEFTILAPILATSTTSKHTLEAIAECLVVFDDRDASEELKSVDEQMINIKEFTIRNLYDMHIWGSTYSSSTSEYCTNNYALSTSRINSRNRNLYVSIINNDVTKSKTVSNNGWYKCKEDFKIVAKLSKPF